MVLKYFNSNRISLVWFISLFPLVYWIPSFFSAAYFQPPEVSGVPFGRLILAFNRDFRFLASLVALILIIVNGYMLIQLNTIHIFIPGRTQLPAFLYSALAISITSLHQLTPQLIASSLLILLLFRILSTYKSEGISLNFLDAGLLVSLASLFYFPAVAFFLFLLFALIILRPFIWREWTFAAIGLVLPYLLLASVYYLVEWPFSGYLTDISATWHKTEQHFRMREIVNWSYIAVLLIIGSIFMIRAIDSMKIHARKFFLVFLDFFLFSVLIFLILPGWGIGMVFFTSAPLAYLFSYYFVKCRRHWANEILFILLLLLLLWQRF
jgi:hypothetical protein